MYSIDLVANKKRETSVKETQRVHMSSQRMKIGSWINDVGHHFETGPLGFSVSKVLMGLSLN